ncbi:hypothetical protein AC578_2026 [Pseudocercospora eumusae]|uniref:Cupin 2 conserved barrel domain-containing protein n=1 Tax=Pseudocercospora eumusae TaxID=321146 RepID=A0A139HH44_9PEZI|nr:hypothetical protein AC578_2026 [Pseudocercospora eumusae]
MIRGGTVLRYVDIAPQNTSPMHRTVSVDYGIVLEWQVEAIMDPGESRLLNRGDVVVQRATNHAWRNVSKTEWAQMLYVLQEAQTVTLPNGITLREDYGSMTGVRASTRVEKEDAQSSSMLGLIPRVALCGYALKSPRPQTIVIRLTFRAQDDGD